MRYTIRNHDLCQGIAISERFISYRMQCVWERDVNKLKTIKERTCANRLHSVLYFHTADLVCHWKPRSSQKQIFFHFSRTADSQHTGTQIQRPCYIVTVLAAIAGKHILFPLRN